MSERILKALMQLFAIIAKVDTFDEEEIDPKKNTRERAVVELFLRQELNPEQVKAYLAVFDEYILAHHSTKKRKDGKQKRTSVNSVKILRICAQINSELTQKQRIIVLVRILEYIQVQKNKTGQEQEFAQTVADSFNIDEEEFASVRDFVQSGKKDFNPADPNLLVIRQSIEGSPFKEFSCEGLEGEIWVLRISSVNFYFFKYFGKEEIYLNGQLISNERHHILTQGSSIRSPRIQTIFYSDIIYRFLAEENRERFVFQARHISYKFQGGNVGLQELSFSEENGRLIGIMGASGAGKSTLLNILNGNMRPTKGVVVLNGINIHEEPERIEGVIGYVSQDDLLIEELTVFQNLYFNAKLCFSELNEKQISRRVLSLLTLLGLYEAKDLKVGSPMEKTISGGQRKRLNIALELIREPSILFVDEPTSGLSSRDSENIMDLLKELSLKGKLVYVVIHQPSSDIFKMFDSLMILDQGGYPIYKGNPTDAVIYFRRCINHVNSDESECRVCGNVNPEQIFNIIESKVVDEYGNQTMYRKTPAVEWNALYREALLPKIEKEIVAEYPTEAPQTHFSIPNKWRQFKVFLTRDVLSKLTNRQYVLINLLEAPVLAVILSFFIKFFSGESYRFEDNENIPQYIFIAVVVALFIGLTVAAEEIIKDRKIKKREAFLNLSKGSYLASKIAILFTISAIQSLLFVVAGNFILEIKGMWLEYWFTFFTLACFANMTGLNISASFNSAKVIYILIPLVIIPQLLFSGVIVKFDKLHPILAKEGRVPWIGDLMASRWAYEALAVQQFMHNDFERNFYALEQQKSNHEWMRDFWVPEMQNLLRGTNRSAFEQEIVKFEFAKTFSRFKDVPTKEILHRFSSSDSVTVELAATEMEEHLEDLKTYHNRELAFASARLDSLILSMNADEFKSLKANYFNKALADQVTNRNELVKLTYSENELVRKKDLIYAPATGSFLHAHFYAPTKQLFGVTWTTYWANHLVLWFMTLTLAVALYFDALLRLITLVDRISIWLKARKSVM